MAVLIEKKGKVCTIILSNPEARNAVDKATAQELAAAFREFEADDTLHAAVLWGDGGTFCAGADLKALVEPGEERSNQLHRDMSKDGPMGPTRMRLSKPVIAAVAGYAVAGGLELACWCDLRVVEKGAIFGVFCRRFGVPLIDGGTQHLPKLIGLSRALDMILTGRPVEAEEAFAIGLANRLVEPGRARQEAEKLAAELADFPQTCLRSDRQAVYMGYGLEFEEGLQQEFEKGLQVIASRESLAGAAMFKGGKGRHGDFVS